MIARRALRPLVPLRSWSPERLAGPAFGPYAALLRDLAQRVGGATFPSVADLNAVLGPRIDRALGAATIRFEPQRGRRRGRLASLEDAYEARIDARGLVPTRACLHDLANALVWARFPRSKRALAARQHAALRRDVPVFEGVLPNARSPERDVLSMLDEGAILEIGATRLVFGHAILEHLASSDEEVYGLPVALPDRAQALGDLDAIDEALRERIVDESRFRSAERPAIGARASFSEAELDRVLHR